MTGWKLGPAWVGWLLAGCAGHAAAQHIYTCVDSKGRRLTADRPIMDCLDRQQQELNASGTVRRVHKPSMTADEIAAEEAKARRAVEQKQRDEEEKKRGKVLLARYPDITAHEKERSEAVRALDDILAAGRKRDADLQAEYKKLTADATRAIDQGTRLRMRRQADDVQQQISANRKQLAEREEERKRVSARFDEELAKLKVLWAQQTGAQPLARKP